MEKLTIHDLEETVLRLHAYLRRLENEHGAIWAKCFEKIEKQGVSFLSRQQKVAISEYFEYKFYEGKLMAYMTALDIFDYPETVRLVERLRGMRIVGNKMLQSQKIPTPIEKVGP